MAAAKKKERESGIYTDVEFNEVVVEELGDLLWYMCCLSLRLGVSFTDLYSDLSSSRRAQELDLNSSLADLGRLAGKYLDEDFVRNSPEKRIRLFLSAYFSTTDALRISTVKIIEYNEKKIKSRFMDIPNPDLPTFDKDFPEYEQIPKAFTIEFIERTKIHHAMRWNGVFIGEPLTDNISPCDGYRFHDVFHFSYAAILHWSPTFRALIKHKRKSESSVDEEQDGGRAIVVEEGLSAWIFNIAKNENYFEGKDSLTFDMLKNVQRMVKGFEVEKCPLSLWERAILDGYKVFRDVHRNEGGVVICNKDERTIEYMKEI